MVKFDPILGKLRTRDIPEYTSDPSTPKQEEAWVLRSGVVTPGGKLNAIMGLGFPYIGVTGGSYTYTFKYRTKEGTTVTTSLT